MGLTLLAIPFIILGVFLKPYDAGGQRCMNIAFLSKEPYCFEQTSQTPEIIKYGCLAFGFVLIYAGRRQIRRSRGE